MVKSDDARKKDKKNLLPYFTQSGENREENGDQYIANMTDGAWAGFKYFSFDGDETTITVTLRGTASGTLQVLTKRGGECAAKIEVKPSVAYASYRAVFSVSAGIWPLYFVFEGSGAFDFQQFIIN